MTRIPLTASAIAVATALAAALAFAGPTAASAGSAPGAAAGSDAPGAGAGATATGAATKRGGPSAATDSARQRRGRSGRRGNRPRRRGKVVRVMGSQFGRVIADRRGGVYYLFDAETTSRSRCYGACAKAWPPVITKGRPRAGRGTHQRLIGATRRRNGKWQVTYAGQPLYYYEHDSPGVILCQNVYGFGGLWQVMRPSGKAVT